MNRRQKEAYEKNKTPAVYTYLRICSTFGITMAMNIYLLSHLLGGWLDGKFGTSVVFRVVFLFVALICSFVYLFRSVSVSQKIEKEQIEEKEKTDKSKTSLELRMEELRKGLKQ